MGLAKKFVFGSVAEKGSVKRETRRNPLPPRHGAGLKGNANGGSRQNNTQWLMQQFEYVKTLDEE
ncbi:unknown [Roseburia sp. CAG:309]|nr:unknown [Roseburia sp. CAG:309]